MKGDYNEWKLVGSFVIITQQIVDDTHTYAYTHTH